MSLEKEWTENTNKLFKNKNKATALLNHDLQDRGKHKQAIKYGKLDSRVNFMQYISRLKIMKLASTILNNFLLITQKIQEDTTLP